MKKFTLIELLVVISIITVLMSLLLPALSTARRYGKETTCLNNQREVMIRILMYTIDYKGFLMPSGLENKYGKFMTQHYSMFLENNPYAGNNKNNIGICPEDYGLKYKGKQWKASNYVVLSPTLYNDVNVKKESDYAGGGIGQGVMYHLSYQTNCAITGKYEKTSVKFESIKNPNLTYLFVDGYTDNCRGPDFKDISRYSTFDIENGEIKSFGAVGKGSGRDWQAIQLRHRKNVILSYCDGSSRRFKGPTVDPISTYKDYAFLYAETGRKFFDTSDGFKQLCSKGESLKKAGLNVKNHFHLMNDPFGGNTGGKRHPNGIYGGEEGMLSCGFVSYSGGLY